MEIMEVPSWPWFNFSSRALHLLPLLSASHDGWLVDTQANDLVSSGRLASALVR